MVVNLWGVDKYGSKYRVSQTNLQVKIGGTYARIRTGVVYILEVKDMRTLCLNEEIYLWYVLI